MSINNIYYANSKKLKPPDASELPLPIFYSSSFFLKSPDPSKLPDPRFLKFNNYLKSPDPSDLPNPYELFPDLIQEKYNKKATDEIKKMLGIN